MAEFLGSASPDLLLMFMAVPIIGAIIFAIVLFIFYSGRSKKQQMKLGFQPRTAAVSPVLSDFWASSNQPGEPTTGLAAPVLPNSQASPATPNNDTFASSTELNLDLLSPQMDTEASMMNASQSPHKQKAGLSARLGNRPQPAPALPQAQPGVTSQAAPGLAVKPAGEPLRQPVALPKPAEPLELLRLLREPQSGQLIVEIAGRRYTKLTEIADKEIGQYILKLAAQLLAFTNGMIATDAGLKTLPAPKVDQTPMPVAAPAPTSLPASQPAAPIFAPQPSSDVEAKFLASLRAQPTTPVQPAKQERKGLFGRSKPAEVEPLLPALNLAQQINEIAQARLRYSPLAATTKLEITSDPGGGILIDVNGMVYHGSDDIPYPEVKELIKASIKEWEGR